MRLLGSEKYIYKVKELIGTIVRGRFSENDAMKHAETPCKKEAIMYEYS